MYIKGLLTIGIPTYNGSKNFPELLASIKMLGLPDDAFEILVVDNGSTDDTVAVIEHLKIQYPNIVYHRNHTNIGRIENWNKTAELARGEFLILMNVNDRFLSFDAGEYLQQLKDDPEISLVMNDVLFEDYQYPNWINKGLVELNAYVRKTFLDINYLEFNSLGVLQQHIFRTELIRKNNITFDEQLPRTTDRVFIAQVIKAGGGKFLYSGSPIVSWHLNAGRYHHQVHSDLNGFQFDELWGNEYQANIEIARIVNIPYRDMLVSQMISAAFMRLVKWVRAIKSMVFKKPSADEGIEIPTAHVYLGHLKRMAQENHISVNYTMVNALALKRAFNWLNKKPRTIKTVDRPQFSVPKANEVYV